MNKVLKELEENLLKAGIALYYQDGKIKSVHAIMNEVAQVASTLSPQLMGAIVANLAGVEAKDSQFLNR